MAQIVFTESADADANAILEELKVVAGLRTASKYRTLFSKLYAHLADYPDGGPPRRSLGPRIRIGIVFPYLVIYEHDAIQDVVTVLRILHGRRKISGTMLR